MKKIFLLFAFTIALSCSSDDPEPQPEQQDFSYFLQQQTPQFKAKLNNISVHYQFGFQTYQMGSAALNASGTAGDPRRVLRFVLNQENGNNQFYITTPVYDPSSESEYNEVFGLGLKGLGPDPDDFYVQIRNQNGTFRICNQESDYKIEVLKTEELSNGELQVWFRISSVNAEGCSGGTPFEIENGLIIARFTAYKNF